MVKGDQGFFENFQKGETFIHLFQSGRSAARDDNLRLPSLPLLVLLSDDDDNNTSNKGI